MFLPEYGRHIHEMVDALLLIEDREMRNRQAKGVIAIMGNLFPALRDSPAVAHKLWDHLFIMSDFRLDVDSPYPIPTANTLYPTPARLPYPRHNFPMKHYGLNIQKIVKALSHEDNKQSLDQALSNVARFMRTKSYEYNQEHPDNATIIKDIRKMADGSIDIDENAINNIRSDYKNSVLSHQKKGLNRNQKGKQNKNSPNTRFKKGIKK